MCMSLVNGGAIVDFRNKLDGSTALHRTVAKSNIEALQTLLDLGMLYVKYNLNQGCSEACIISCVTFNTSYKLKSQ